MAITKGDQLGLTESFIRAIQSPSPNPLKNPFRATPYGLSRTVHKLFWGSGPHKEENFPQTAEDLEKVAEKVLAEFEPLQGLDFEKESDGPKILEVIKAHDGSAAYFAMSAALFTSQARDAIEAGDANRAAWATMMAERSRALMIYCQDFEQVVWMGQGAKRIVDILRIWAANRDNKDEEFWHQTFKENSYVLSQVFAVPMVVLDDKAFVGGMQTDRSGSKFVDYLCAAESSSEAILIEIKTPCTPLLQKSPYRKNVFAPNRELAGSVVQLQNYRSEFVRDFKRATEQAKYDVTALSPRCAVIVGDAEKQLEKEPQRRSFELFRGSLKDIEVVTFDELFRKVAILAELFGLTVAQKKPEKEGGEK